MGSIENLGLVHRMYDALNAQDLDAHHRFWTENMIWHGPPGFGDIHGIEAFKDDVLGPFYSTFPDYHVVNEIEVANENWVAATGILTGTPQHEWLGVPASGKSIVMRFSDFWRVEDGKLAENWVMVDNLGVMQQLAGLTETRITFSALGGLSGGLFTLGEYAGSILGLNAVQASGASDDARLSQDLYDNLENRATSLSGVNIDEEMASLIVFQTSFAASARVMRTAAEMLEMLIDLAA